MNPSVKDRLSSVVRALNGVVLPALPPEASLAQEQVMLAMGHIQIILAQMDAEQSFIAEEAQDFTAMASIIAAIAQGGSATIAAKAALEIALKENGHVAAEVKTSALQDAIDALLIAFAKDGDTITQSAINAEILKQGAIRADKDRRWFAAMGFDIDYSGG